MTTLTQTAQTLFTFQERTSHSVPFGQFYLSRRYGLCTVSLTEPLSRPWVVFLHSRNDPRQGSDRPELLEPILTVIATCEDVIQSHMRARMCTYLLATTSTERSPP